MVRAAEAISRQGAGDAVWALPALCDLPAKNAPARISGPTRPSSSGSATRPLLRIASGHGFAVEDGLHKPVRTDRSNESQGVAGIEFEQSPQDMFRRRRVHRGREGILNESVKKDGLPGQRPSLQQRASAEPLKVIRHRIAGGEVERRAQSEVPSRSRASTIQIMSP